MLKDNKLMWADHLRAFATISVVLLHVSAAELLCATSSSDWWISNIFDSFVRTCVPLFFMLTGALLLPRTYDLGDFLKKRFSRILLPFLFWSLIYILDNLLLKRRNGIILDPIEVGRYIFVQLRDGVSFHLWYVYVIIGIYLITPIISKWIINSTPKEIRYYIILWFIVILFNLPIINKFKPKIELIYFSGFLGYTILGYFLSVKTSSKRLKLIALLLFFTGTLITIVGTYIVTKNKVELNDSFYNYLSPNVVMAAIGAFLFFKNTNFTNGRFTTFVQFISKYSYGIYLVHVLVLMQLAKIGISPPFLNLGISIPLTTILCLMISSIIIYTINKLPFGSYISG